MQELPGQYHFKSAQPSPPYQLPHRSLTRPWISLLPGLLGHLRAMPRGHSQQEGPPGRHRGPPNPGKEILANKSLIYTLPLYLCTTCDLHGVNPHPFPAQALGMSGTVLRATSPAVPIPVPLPAQGAGCLCLLALSTATPSPCHANPAAFQPHRRAFPLAKTRKGSFMWLKSPTVIM